MTRRDVAVEVLTLVSGIALGLWGTVLLLAWFS